MTIDQLNVNMIEHSRAMLRSIDGQTIHDLTESIKQYGVIQPIVIFLNENQKYEVICGNHRLCAARHAGLTLIPVIIRTCLHSDALLLSITENIQRLEMNPLREGEIYHNIIQNSALTAEYVAQKIHKSESYVKNRILIYNKLNPKLKPEVGKSLLLCNAVALSKLPQNEQLMVYAKMKAVSEAHLPSEKKGFGGGNPYEGGELQSPYCYCEKCGSKHLRSVSIGDTKRAEKILSKMQ